METNTRKSVIFALIICLIVQNSYAAEDQASACRGSGSTQTCDAFSRCCARHCQGAHDTSCTEGGGRIESANCFCEENTQDGERNVGLTDIDTTDSTTGGRRGSTGSRHSSIGHHGTTVTSISDGDGGGSISNGGGSVGGGRVGGGSVGTVGDHTSVCRARHSNCIDFTTCCRERCPNPASVSCTPGQLFYAACGCDGETGSRTPERGGSISSRVGSTLGSDHTSSCKITANNDCLEFRRCCSSKCETRYSSRCSGDGRSRMLSAYCKCTSSSTTTFGRGESLPNLPRRDSPSLGGFQDFTDTCQNLALSGSCDSFNLCCRTRCGFAREKSQSCSSTNGRITSAACTCTT